MNKRLLKLALDAHLLNYVEHETPRHYFIDGNADIETVEDFSKLIIQECIEQCYADYDSKEDWDKGVRWAVNQIKEHFGVE